MAFGLLTLASTRLALLTSVPHAPADGQNSNAYSCSLCLQCFDAVGWAAGTASGLQKLSGGCWCSYLSGARCRLAYDQLMPLPLTVSCSSKIQIGFTFLVPAHLGSPGKRAVKRVCVCVCACSCSWVVRGRCLRVSKLLTVGSSHLSVGRRRYAVVDGVITAGVLR